MKPISKEIKKEENKFDLQEAFVLWRKESKGIEYFSGYDLNKNKMIAFKNNSKKNDKEPDYRVYYQNEEGKREEKSCCGLWESKSNKGNDYLSGITSDNEKIIAFFGDINQEKRPFIKAYFKKD